jgi:Zn-dependent oligopeptidase
VPFDVVEIPSHFTEQLMYDYSFVSRFIQDMNGNPIEKDFYEKIAFRYKLKDFLSFEETIYFSLLDLKLHSGHITPVNMLEINQKLLEESFAFNFKTDSIQLKSYFDQMKESMASKGVSPSLRLHDLIDWESRVNEEKDVMGNFLKVLKGEEIEV